MAAFQFEPSHVLWERLPVGMREGELCEGFDIRFGYGCLLLCCDWLFARLRTVKVKRRYSMLENIVLILISLLLFGYLMYALLKPENF